MPHNIQSILHWIREEANTGCLPSYAVVDAARVFARCWSDIPEISPEMMASHIQETIKRLKELQTFILAGKAETVEQQNPASIEQQLQASATASRANIRHLRSIAEETGDRKLVQLCNRALSGVPDGKDAWTACEQVMAQHLSKAHLN